MKKTISTILAIAAVATMATTTLAQSVDVNGSVDPITTLDVVSPVSVTFKIDSARNFNSSAFEIINQTPAPITVTAESIAAKSDTPVKVVADTTYTAQQWDNLNKTKTQAEIALGLVADNDTSNLVVPAEETTQWFGTEGANSDLALGIIESAYKQDVSPKMTLNLDSKYGKAWDDVKTCPMILCLPTGLSNPYIITYIQIKGRL